MCARTRARALRAVGKQKKKKPDRHGPPSRTKNENIILFILRTAESIGEKKKYIKYERRSFDDIPPAVG